MKDWRELERERLAAHPEIRRARWRCHHSAHGMADRPYLRTRDGSKGHGPTADNRIVLIPNGRVA